MDANLRGIVTRSALIVLLLIGLGMIAAQLASVFLLVFAAVVLAVLIRALAGPIQRLGVPETGSVLLAVATIAGALALVGWLLGAQIGAQLGDIAGRLPSGTGELRRRLATVPIIGGQLATGEIGGGVAGRVAGFASTAAGVVADLAVVVIGGIYLAVAPHDYAGGVARLFPADNRERVRRALAATGRALHKFLLGQLLSMTVVGTVTGLGLWLVGVPAPLALGLITGVLNFIPTFGPFLAAVPGVLLGLSDGPQTALYAGAIYLVVQQLEGNLLTPIIQKRAVSLPPALLIFALLGFGALFGPLGIVVAAPLTVALYVLVTTLYVQDALGDEVRTPGAPKEG